MAKNFDKMNKRKIANVAKKSNEQANLITIKYYQNEDIIDCPFNGEDLSHTADLETAIKELGFTDPIEITDTFDFEFKDGKYISEDNNGKYMIISGHRRRRAGINVGMDKFPCILRHFDNPATMRNYILMSNSQRNLDNDPLLYASRYKMHDVYLESIGFKGSKREEIAKRMGVTVAHADRYKQLNKVIMPIIDLVRNGQLGMSSVTDTGLYTHSPDEQIEIKKIFDEVTNEGLTLTRECVKKIIEGFRAGKSTWAEIKKEEKEEKVTHGEDLRNPQDGISVMKINTDPDETKDEEPEEPNPLRNNEINYDFSHRIEASAKAQELIPDYEDFEPLEKGKSESKESDSVSKKNKNGEKINKYMEHLETLLNDFYNYECVEDGRESIKVMGKLASTLINEMSENSYKYECIDDFKKSLNEIKEDIKRVDYE